MATSSSILAWKIPRTEEPGRLPFMESQRVGHSTKLARTLSHLILLVPASQLTGSVVYSGNEVFRAPKKLRGKGLPQPAFVY